MSGDALTFDPNWPYDPYWRLIEPVWNRISTTDEPEVFLQQFREVPTTSGHLFAAFWCQAEVRNGGFHQFFFNSTGILAPEALAGFHAMGLREWASLLEEAIGYFGTPYPRDRKQRWDQLMATPNEDRKAHELFNRLDDRFYCWLDEEEDCWERAANSYAELNA